MKPAELIPNRLFRRWLLSLNGLAPPAPAMITSRPRSRAVAQYSNSRSGVRCADTTCTSCGMSSNSSRSAAPDMVSQSDREPMMIPTSTFSLTA